MEHTFWNIWNQVHVQFYFARGNQENAWKRLGVRNVGAGEAKVPCSLMRGMNEVQAHHMWLSLALRISPVLSVFFSIYIIAKALVTGAFWHFSADLLYPVVHSQFVLFLMALLGTQFCAI